MSPWRRCAFHALWLIVIVTCGCFFECVLWQTMTFVTVVVVPPVVIVVVVVPGAGPAASATAATTPAAASDARTAATPSTPRGRESIRFMVFMNSSGACGRACVVQ